MPIAESPSVLTGVVRWLLCYYSPMMLRIVKQLFCVLKTPTHFIPPAPLIVNKSEQIPTLKVEVSKKMLTHSWAHRPFLVQKIMAPIFSLLESTYTGETIELRGEIFNQPIRRDLIYRLYDWRRNLNKIRTKRARTQSDTAGSGRKPRPQKGQGKARLGNIRAPGRKKGVKVHGPKPKIYSYHLNQKIKLKALKSLLSATVAEGKIRIVDSQDLVEGKTKLLQKALLKHLPENTKICFITSTNFDANFERAQRNIKNVRWYTAANFDVLDILQTERVIITKQGLKQMTLNIFKSEYIICRQPHMQPLQEKAKKQEEEIEPYDPSKPLQFKFRILSDYLQLFQETKLAKAELLQKEIEKVKKITGQ